LPHYLAAGDQPVDVRHGRIADDLLVVVVLHHDHEQVIEPMDTLRHLAFSAERAAGDRCGQQAGRNGNRTLHGWAPGVVGVCRVPADTAS
jgi:hypothetical protein